MSDYLSSLVEKSFGQTTEVKPRPAPLFAPAPQVAGALAQGIAPALVADLPLESSRRSELATEAQPIFTAGQPPRPSATPARFAGLTWEDVSRNVPFNSRIEPMTPETSFLRSDQSAAPATSELTHVSLMHARRRGDAAGKEHGEPQPEQVSPRARALPQVERPILAQDQPLPVSDNQPATALESAHQQPARVQATRTARADQTAGVRLTPGQRAAHQEPGSELSTAFQDEADRSEHPAENPSGQDVAKGRHPERTDSTTIPILKPPRPATVQPARSPAAAEAQEPAVSSHGEAKPVQLARRATVDDIPANQERALIRPALRVAQLKPTEELRPAAGRPSARTRADDIAPPLQPAIHVTIGRIEVRAAPAPAPVARKQAAAPSLDEYLKMRRGGQP